MINIKKLIENVDLSTEGSIKDLCDKITAEEEIVNNRLEGILSRQCHIETKMRNIGRALTGLNIVRNDSSKLSDMITTTASLAENVSAKVRRLDEARNRVSECQQRVHDLIDLQLCSQGVITAIRDEDYEKGAGHVNRFLSMDQNLLQKTADDVSGSITSVSKAVSTLENAAEQIRQIVNQKFEEAVRKDDLASVERFFKIFPLIGLHEEGIQKFSVYICSKLELKCQKELRTSMDTARADKRQMIAYADSLTLLFENIARVVEVNQPILESYYGPGRLVQMITILQGECDKEVKYLLLEFNKIRQISRRISQINEYIKSGGNTTGKGHYRKASGSSTDKLNPKDIDALIGEITIMHARAELYIKFIKRRISNDLDSSSLEDEEKSKILKTFEDMLQKSDMSRQMQELLGTYLLFERYFMEESVLKAISLDSYEQGQTFSSMVDDVFFIIRKSIRRSITTHSLDGICAVINNAASSFEGDFITALKTPLKAGYPSGYIDLAQAYNAFQTSLQQGRIQTSDAEQSRNTFIVHLNNADRSTEFIETLYAGMLEEVKSSFVGMSSREKEILESCMSGLKSVGDSLKALVEFGMQQLRSSAIKPRLHPWVDQFLQHNHNLNEEELSTYEAGETFIQFLIMQIDGLLISFKTVLSPRNYDALVGILAADVTARLERAVKKSSFNRLGGLVLDQEVRALGSYLTGATSWSVRDKLARLTQMATLLNLEKVTEISDYWNQGDTTSWRVTPNEVRLILALRSDFRMEEIKRLKL